MNGFTLRLMLAGALSALTFVGALAIGVTEMSTPTPSPLPTRSHATTTVTRALAAAVAAELRVPLTDVLTIELADYADAKYRALTVEDPTQRVAAVSAADRKLTAISGKDVSMGQTERVDRILGLTPLS